MAMTEKTLESILHYLLSGDGDPEMDQEVEKITLVEKYDDAGILGYDKGVVIKTGDGDEFQLTIRRSRWGTPEPEEEPCCDECGGPVSDPQNTLCDDCNADYERMAVERPMIPGRVF